jgi:hypothetical protein
MLLQSRLALLALQARERLRANTNSVAELQVLHLVSDTNNLSDDFMSYARGVPGVSPSGT